MPAWASAWKRLRIVFHRLVWFVFFRALSLLATGHSSSTTERSVVVVISASSMRWAAFSNSSAYLNVRPRGCRACAMRLRAPEVWRTV